MKALCVGTIFSLCVMFCGNLFSAEAIPTNAVWNSLQRGNQKFIRNPKYAAERKKWAPKQNPPCIILGCSDSRVPPSLVFQQSIGKLFTCRVAGNVTDNVVVDSINFAVGHYDVSLIVVLGHSNCGAVEGALDHLRENNGRIDVEKGFHNAVIVPIEIAIKKAGIDIWGPHALEKSVVANIHYQADQLLKKSPDVREAIRQGRLAIIGAEYSLESGFVKELFRIDCQKNKL